MLPYKLPFVASDQLRLTRFGPEGEAPTVYLFADVLDEIIRHAAWRPELAATLLVGERYQGPSGPYLELQGFAESSYVSKPRDLVERFQQGHPRTCEQLEGQGAQRILGWSLDDKGAAAGASREAWLLHRTFFNLPEQLFLALDTAGEVLAIYRLDEGKNPFSVGFYLISRAGQPMPFGAAAEAPEEELEAAAAAAVPELDVRDNAWAGALALPRMERTRTTRAITDEEALGLGEEDEGAARGPVPVLPSFAEEESGFEVEDEESPRQTMIARGVASWDEDELMPPRRAIPTAGARLSDEQLDELLLDSLDGPPRQTMVAHALMDRGEDSAEEEVSLASEGRSRDTWVVHALPDPEEDEGAEPPSGPSLGEPTREVAIPAPVSEEVEQTNEGWNFLGEGEGVPAGLKPMPGRGGYPVQGQQRPTFVAREALPASDSGDEEAPPEAAVLKERLNKIKQLRQIQDRSGGSPRGGGAPNNQGGDDGHDS